MFLAWTTVTHHGDAERLASSVIAHNLAACVQIEGPIVSHYRWQGQAERSEEFRLLFKLLPAQADNLEKYVMANHPYETPEWILVPVQRVGEKYLSWATANSTP